MATRISFKSALASNGELDFSCRDGRPLLHDAM